LLRPFVAGLALLALPLLAGVTPANANTSSSSVQSLQSYASCDYGYHTMTLSAGLALDMNRFPNGAYVAYRYSWRFAGQAALQTSDWFYATVSNEIRGESGVVMWDLASLPGRVISVIPGASYESSAQVAVWNGRSFEYTADGGTSYLSSFKGYWGQATSSCHT